MNKRPLFTIFLVVFFDLLSFGIVIPILPYYSRTFGASAFELGWLMAAYSIAQFLFSPVWGSLSDRVGRRPVLLATILAGAVSMSATALAPTFWLLFLARFLAGAFAANISTASAYITDITSEKNRAKGMGVIGAGFGLGFIFGPAVGGVLSVHGYRVPILCAAALGLANFVFAFFVLREPERTEAIRKRTWSGIQSALRQPRTALPITLFFLHTLAFTQLEVPFGLFMLERFGYGSHDAGWFLAGFGVVSAILQGGLIGRLSRKFGEAKLLRAGFFVLFFSLALAAYASSPGYFATCLFVIALGTGVANPSLSSLASKGAEANQRGSVMGVYQSAGSLARIVGPPTAGLAFDRLGPGSPFLLASGIMGLALAYSLTARRSMA